MTIMKIRLSISYLLAFIFLCLPVVSWAASVTLRWQANTEADIAGYNLYYGTASRDYGLPIPTGNVTSYTVDNLDEGQTYYFSLTALDTSGNESGYSSEISANATSSEPVTEDYILLLSYNSDRSNAVKLSGQTISGDVYIYLNPESYVSQVIFSIDGQTHNTENYAPYDIGMPFDTTSLPNGSHTISALIRLQDGTSQTITSTCITDNSIVGSGVTSDLPSSVSLTSDIASPQTEGTSVTFRASATGGSGSYEYKFWEYSAATKWKWVVVRDFSASNEFVWETAGKTGTSQIGVWVRNAGTDFDQNLDQTKDIKSFTVEELPLPSSVSIIPSSVSLTSDIASPQTEGTSVTFRASATGGSGSYEYKFWEYSAATKWKWVVVRDFSASNEFVWETAGKTGTSQIGVWVRNAGTDFDRNLDQTKDIKSFTVEELPLPSSVSLTSDIASPQTEGTSVTFRASALVGAVVTNINFGSIVRQPSGNGSL